MKLTATTGEQRALLALMEHAPDRTLMDNVAALPSGDPRTLAAAWEHVLGRARAELHGRSGWVPDATVLDWIAAYYAGPAPEPAKKGPAKKPERHYSFSFDHSKPEREPAKKEPAKKEPEPAPLPALRLFALEEGPAT